MYTQRRTEYRRSTRRDKKGTHLTSPASPKALLCCSAISGLCGEGCYGCSYGSADFGQFIWVRRSFCHCSNCSSGSEVAVKGLSVQVCSDDLDQKHAFSCTTPSCACIAYAVVYYKGKRWAPPSHHRGATIPFAYGEPGMRPVCHAQNWDPLTFVIVQTVPAGPLNVHGP